jgi:hypothetical protein
MNAVIRSLNPGLVRSVGLFVSPTAPAEIQPEDAEVARGRYDHPSWWQSLLESAGALKPNVHSFEGRHWANAIVSLQGASYLAAQYIEKRLAAEVFAIHGTRPEEGARPITVSANVAGISRTRSMQTKAFQLGFEGAPSLGLETYDPDTTRWLSGLLMLHDFLNPMAPGSAQNPLLRDHRLKADALFSQQVHGGIYAYPYAIEGAIRLAGVIGLFKKPGILFARSAARTPMS